MTLQDITKTKTHTSDLKFEDDRGPGPHVACSTILAVLPDLTREVLGRSAEFLLPALEIRDEGRKAEVAENEVACAVEEDVRGFEVAVDDTPRVEFLKAEKLYGTKWSESFSKARRMRRTSCAA